MRNGRQWCAFLLLALLCLGGPLWAGVVEDAEQALSSVPTDNPGGKRRMGGDGQAFTSSPGGSSLGQGRPATTGTTPGKGRGSQARATTVAPGSEGTTPMVVGQEQPTEPVVDEALALRKARDRSDNLTTSFSLLILFALIAAAGLYSRRSGNAD